jgi:hypothetical protein
MISIWFYHHVFFTFFMITVVNVILIIPNSYYVHCTWFLEWFHLKDIPLVRLVFRSINFYYKLHPKSIHHEMLKDISVFFDFWYFRKYVICRYFEIYSLKFILSLITVGSIKSSKNVSIFLIIWYFPWNNQICCKQQWRDEYQIILI